MTTPTTQPGAQEPPEPAPAAGEVARIESMVLAYASDWARLQWTLTWGEEGKKAGARLDLGASLHKIRAALADLAAQAERGRRVAAAAMGMEAAIDRFEQRESRDADAVRTTVLTFDCDSLYVAMSAFRRELGHDAALAPDGGEEDQP